MTVYSLSVAVLQGLITISFLRTCSRSFYISVIHHVYVLDLYKHAFLLASKTVAFLSLKCALVVFVCLCSSILLFYYDSKNVLGSFLNSLLLNAVYWKHGFHKKIYRASLTNLSSHRNICLFLSTVGSSLSLLKNIYVQPWAVNWLKNCIRNSFVH